MNPRVAEKQQLATGNGASDKSPWALSIGELLTQLKTLNQGLTNNEAEERLRQYGPNALPESEEESIWAQLLDAFKDPLVLTLSAAALLSGTIGLLQHTLDEVVNFVAIMIIVIFMALTGFAIDRQTRKALEKLKQLQQTFARVFRGDKLIEIQSVNLVPGDVISLTAGDLVPADARVIQAVNAAADEARLTGESRPRTKTPDPVPEKTDLADRSNMIYAGTYIATGNITAVVTSTGLNTELGKIYTQVQETEETATPLQKQLEGLGNFLMIATLIVCVGVVGIYVIFQGLPILTALISAVALAIAFIPEALGPVITMSLALGVGEMVKKGAIIKKPRAAEGAGSVSRINTDKTGTVTVGQMKVTSVWLPDNGETKINGNGEAKSSELQQLLTVIRYCNNMANPSEVALASLMADAGIDISAEILSRRQGEIPFTSDRKMMSTLATDDRGRSAIRTKGAPEKLLSRCIYYLRGNKQLLLNEIVRQQITEAVERYEGQGNRVFAFADRELTSDVQAIDENSERDLTFIGLASLSDPARSEVAVTVSQLQNAGITPVMITGDSQLTAFAIAREVGILPINATVNDVVLGSELDEMATRAKARIPKDEIVSGKEPGAELLAKYLSEKDLVRIVTAGVFARTSPTHKGLIIKAQQRNGELVAMAGDGVNDAPSLKMANVGIAMAGGTEIAKEVSDIVLTKGYAAIASAVEVGRTILYRARLYTHALMSTNGAEVGLFIVSALAGWPLPLTAVQLLVINFLGDSWLSMALATEKPEKDVMRQKPRKANEPVINQYMLLSMILQSVVTTMVLGAVFLLVRSFTGEYSLNDTSPAAKAALSIQQTAIFVTFLIQKVARSSFTARSLKQNLWEIGPFSNVWTLAAAALTITIAVIAINIPFLGMTMPSLALLPYLFGLGLIPALVEELVKFIRKHLGATNANGTV